MFVGFPSSKGRDGKWRDLVVPTDDGTKAMIRDTIMEAYRNFEERQP
jgi:DNA-binding cell septation regulator SpoVG